MIERTHGFSMLCNWTTAACASVLSLLPGVSLAQVSGPADVPVAAQLILEGQSPTDPSLTPLWEVIHNQQALFAQVFDQPWSLDEFVLHTSDPLHDDFGTTAGTTAAGESFTLDAIFSSNVDFAGSALPPELMEFVDSYQFQMSVVFARLTGPRASGVPVSLLSFTGVVNSQTEQRVMLLSQLTEDEAFVIEDNRGFRFGRNGTFCFGPIPPADPETEACFDLVASDTDAAYDKLHSSALVGIGVGVVGFVTCTVAIVGTGGIALSACAPLVGAAVALTVCNLEEHAAINANRTAAINCCCIAATCRSEGGTNCPTPNDCRPGTGSFCDLKF